MSKVLQIRRGTAAQSNNFTGLAGEITMDTNAKTIRIHDGTTLGGFALARADLSNVSGTLPGGEGGGEAFSIESVPTTFWTALFSSYNLRAAHFLESGLSSIGNVSYLETSFSSVAQSTNISAARGDCVLVCQTPEAGFAVGEIASAFGIGNRAGPCPNLFLDANGLRARLAVAGESFWVSNKTTGTTTNITNANWKIKFRILLMTASSTSETSSDGTNASFDITSVPSSFWQNLFATYGGAAVDLSGKANTNLSNLASPTQKGNVFTGPDIVVEWATGLTGTGYTNGWYRKYKSGWVEQGGFGNAVSNSSNTNLQVNLLIPMLSTNYYAQARAIERATYFADDWFITGTRSTTSFNTSAASGSFQWEAKGLA